MTRANDFSEAVKREAFSFATGRCPVRGCTQQTVVWDDGTKSVLRLGDVAHIVAASDEGPRSPAALSDSERAEFSKLVDARASVDNAIVLCPNCHRKADRITETFTVGELYRAQQDERQRRYSNDPGLDPVRRSGFSRLTISDFSDNGELLQALIAAVGADRGADAFAAVHDDRDELVALSDRCDSDLAEAKWQTLEYLARCASKLGEWSSAERFWSQAASRAKLVLADRSTIAFLLANAADMSYHADDLTTGDAYLNEARQLDPREPAVLMAGRKSPIALKDLASIDALAGSKPKWQGLRRMHRLLAYLSERELAAARKEMKALDPTTVTRGQYASLALNVELEGARQASGDARPFDTRALEAACTQALPALEDLNARNRADEAVRVRMLIAEAYGLLERHRDSVALLDASPHGESATWEGRAVLASAYISAGEQVRAMRALSGDIPVSAEPAARLLKVQAQLLVNRVSAEQGRALMSELEELAHEEDWIGPAAAAQMPLVSATSGITLPATAEQRLGDRNARALERFRVGMAARDPQGDDWRTGLGDEIHDPAVVRMVFLNAVNHDESDTKKAEAATALLQLDCTPRLRFLAADGLLEWGTTPEVGAIALLSIARDRNAPAALRAQAYDRHLRYLRASDKLGEFLHVYDDELIVLSTESPLAEVRETANHWMPSIERARTARAVASAK